MFVSNEDELPKFDPNEPVFLDTETDGLYGPVRLLQLNQHSAACKAPCVIDYVTYEGNFEKLKKYLETLWLVCHNATYDMSVLGICPERLDDTLYLARHEFLKLESYSLDRVVNACGHSHLYANMDKKEMQKSDFSETALLTPEQYRYAELDVIALAMVWHRLSKHKENMAYKVDMLNMRYALQYQKNGIGVDKELVMNDFQETCDKIATNELELNGLNVNSPLQCKQALNLDSTDKSSLLRAIANGNNLAKLVFEQRRLIKRRSMLESYMYDKVYTIYNVAGAVSGRFTASGKGIKQGINGQQIPRSMKYFFYNADPNIATIEADYSTLELRLAATIFGDNNMRKQLVEGKDLHTEVAARLLGKKPEEVSKDDRTKAKAVNFGFVYGMSAKKFMDYAFDNYGLTLTIDEAGQWRNTYFRMYPQIAMYHKYIWEHYKDPGFFVSTALGRKIAPKLGTDALNVSVQGSGAECTKLAIHYLVKENPEYLGYITNVVHDSIKLEVPGHLKDEAIKKLEAAMLKGWDELIKSSLCKFKDIPMLVEVECK